jgi:SAM-dependent methyltransferase
MNSFPCRSCGASTEREVLDLGIQPLANNLLHPGDIGKPEPQFPLCVAVCTHCFLLQITETIPPVNLFSEYLYFSSFSDALLAHAADAARKYQHEFQLGAKSWVVEIASNDGYLLKNFVSAGIPCLGVEPASNIAAVAVEKGVPTINRFFGADLARELVDSHGRADLILGNNVFAHVHDTNGFVSGLATLLASTGRVVLEFPYACDLIEHLEFDTIYHEHIFYFTLTALIPLFERHGLEVVDVERIPIHGGSLRLTTAHAGAHSASARVQQLRTEELKKGVGTTEYYEGFADRVHQLRLELKELVSTIRKSGKTIAAYGASAKGSTLLNFYGLGLETIDFVADRSTAKQGRLTPGTHIPIVPADELFQRNPDYALLLTWNFATEILAQQSAFRNAGGKFILPVPRVEII